MHTCVDSDSCNTNLAYKSIKDGATNMNAIAVIWLVAELSSVDKAIIRYNRT